jgi:hypothetical protein
VPLLMTFCFASLPWTPEMFASFLKDVNADDNAEIAADMILRFISGRRTESANPRYNITTQNCTCIPIPHFCRRRKQTTHCIICMLTMIAVSCTQYHRKTCIDSSFSTSSPEYSCLRLRMHSSSSISKQAELHFTAYSRGGDEMFA